MIDAKMIKEILTKCIYDNYPVIAGVGPVEQLPNYNRMGNHVLLSHYVIVELNS